MKTQPVYDHFLNYSLRRSLNKKTNTMKTVSGIFDGKRVHLLEKVKKRKKTKVTIHFGDELTNDEIVNMLPADVLEDAFDFWRSSEEDIYQDYVKIKKR